MLGLVIWLAGWVTRNKLPVPPGGEAKNTKNTVLQVCAVGKLFYSALMKLPMFKFMN